VYESLDQSPFFLVYLSPNIILLCVFLEQPPLFTLYLSLNLLSSVFISRTAAFLPCVLSSVQLLPIKAGEKKEEEEEGGGGEGGEGEGEKLTLE
jgi:hypothetical protein